jgi:hypothetical protein
MRIGTKAAILVIILGWAGHHALADNFALLFDGKRRGASVDNPMVDAGQVVTWEAWVLPSAAGSRVLYHRAHYSDKSLGFAISSPGRGVAAFGFLAGAASGISEKSARATVTYPSGSWVHVAGSYDGEYLRVYWVQMSYNVDGMRVTTTS